MPMQIQQFDYSTNITGVISWQYDNAPILKSLITQKQAWYDIYFSQFWADWFVNVFDLSTANEFGLVVWAIILNMPLAIGPTIDYGPIWGFDPKTNNNQNFDWGNFAVSSQFDGLTTAEKRFLLRLRYFQLTCRCAVPQINAFLALLVPTFHSGSGKLYCVDNLDMTITYVFTFTPDARLLEILNIYDILPRASGVKSTIIVT